MTTSKDSKILSVVHPICCGLDVQALVQFNWEAFPDCYGLPSSPILDKNFVPETEILALIMHC